MNKLLLAIAVAVALYFGIGHQDKTDNAAPESGAPASSGHDAIRAAFDEQRSAVQVSGQGTVAKLLRDDNEGSRHQRFILELPSGQTLLVAHNIDLAPRIDGLTEGDAVAFHGVYEWNPQGGVLHWTHHDPRGQHEAGWLRHAGRTFQ